MRIVRRDEEDAGALLPVFRHRPGPRTQQHVLDLHRLRRGRGHQLHVPRLRRIGEGPLMAKDIVGWGPAKKETPRQTSDRIIKSMQDNARRANQQRKQREK